jgi:hypothetical protein
MKKLFLTAALMAAASMSSFGAACADGLLSAQTYAGDGGVCTLGSWTLSTFGIVAPDTVGFGGTIGADDLYVAFNTFTMGNGAEAFSVTFSDAEGGINYFTASSGDPNQTATWKSIFVIESGPAIQTIMSEWADPNVTTGAGANGSISLQKIITNASMPSNPTLNSATLLAVPGVLIPGLSTNVNIPLPNAITRLGVVDVVQIQGGNAGTSSFTSYTNTFAAAPPQNEIPEPMTFVLMGAGLVGIAALRRRNG